MARRGCLIALLAALAAPAARAHNLGDSYLYLQIREDSLSGRFEIALADLNPALGLSGTELEITAENLGRRIGFLHDYYLERVEIADERGPLTIDFSAYDLLEERGGYVLLPFDLRGFETVPEALTIEYSVLFDEEPSHRGFLLVEHNWATGTFANENEVALVFGPGNRRQRFDLTSSGRLRGFLAVAGLGAEHLLLGLDHLFFLAALLLPVALRREREGWRAEDGVRPVLGRAVKISTAFLVAHTAALSLAALGILRPPEALVETAIALSIVLAAADALRPFFGRRLWWIVFALSLFHGFGFAGALVDLGVLDDYRGLSLAAFNLGAEAAQIVLVASLSAVLFLVRRLAVYPRWVLPAVATATILVAGVWVVERAFGVDVPMRELLPMPVQRVIP